MLNSTAKDACGPCLTPAQIKKQKEQEVKDLKNAINVVSRNMGYEKDTCVVIGQMVVRLIQLTGPLK